MKKVILSFLIMCLLLPVALWAMQETPTGRVEITGVNSANLPEVVITANVFDPVNQPLLGLTEADFELVGELADRARIVDVQNVSDDELPFSVVLVIDVSSSMSGLPIQRAIEAAQLFVESINENDSVAIYTFSHVFTLVQDYTTDTALLRAAIDSISVGGATGLYQAANNSVQLAEIAPNSRRAVILLSDGAEYGGASSVGRGAALAEAQRAGVPVYTIGLGYGADRTYLRELSGGTNALFYESPDPDQLAEIYSSLATLLTSQYILTLNVDVPADGTEYALGLDVTTPFGRASNSATVRAPIPVPIVTAPTFSGPLLEPTVITPNFVADDEVVSASYSIDGGDETLLEDAPFSFTIDPETLAPGAHTLTLDVTDLTGDTGTVTTAFEAGVLPPRVNVVSNLDQVVENVQTVQVEISGQTPGNGAAFQIDDGRIVTDIDAPFGFDVDPRVLAPGAHILTIVASNEGGESTAVDVPFTVANLAPMVAIGGLEAGAVVDEVTPIEVNVIVTQTPVTSVDILVNGQPLDNRVIPSEGIIMSTALLDPMAFTPGAATLMVRATNSSGGVSTDEIDFTIAALPPIVRFDNLANGDELSADQDAVITFVSQTSVRRVEYLLDGQALPAQTSAPWDIPLDVLALGPGEHTLTVTATTANGQTNTASVEFIVTEAPGQTATARVPTATPTPTIDVPATQTVAARQTENAQGTIAANTQVAADATATERSFMATGTAVAQGTGTAVAAAEIAAQATAATATQAAIQATRTEVAAVTAQARAQAAASTATAEFGIQATQTATEATATTAARQTATAEAQAQASQTSVAIAQAATATQAAGIVATQTATEATATTAARQTATAEAQAQASATAQQQVTIEARALQQASATAQQQSTVTAQFEQQASATSQAQQQATAASVAATATQVAGIAATQTATEATATTAAQATATAAGQQATATREAQANASATQQVRQQATATQNARLQATQTMVSAQLATETQSALVVALAATSTRESGATATQAAREDALTQTAEARQATADAAASATQAAREDAMTQTAIARQDAATQTAEARQATADAAASATQAAREDAMTQTAIARQDAATQTAEARRATQDARATSTAQAAQETRVAQLAATATQDAAERAEALTATASSRQTATAEAIGLTATRSVQASATAQTALNVQATSDAGATESADATQAAATQNAQATNDAEAVAAETQSALATVAARETATASVTEEPTITPTDEPTLPPTPTPRGTLVPIEAESQTADVNQLVPILVVIVAALIVLIVIYLILRGGRGRR